MTVTHMRPRRLQPQQRREHLLDTAAAMFAEQPYDDVMIQDIAALADPALRWRAAPLSFRGCHQTDPSPALTAAALAQFDKRRAVRSSRDGWLLTIPVMAEVMPTVR